MESLIDIDPTNKKHHRVKENNFLKFVDCNRENRNLLLGKSVTTVYSRPKSGTAQSKAGWSLNGMDFYFDLSLRKLFPFLITNSHVSRNLITLWSIQRYLLVETRFYVETGQLVIRAD